MTSRDGPPRPLYPGKGVLEARPQAIQSPAQPKDDQAVPLQAWPHTRPELAGHIPYSSPRPLVPVRLDTNESPYPPCGALRADLAELAGALGWLGCELVVLLAPAQFRPAQTYALDAVAVGLVVYTLLRLTEPVAMTRQPPPAQPPPGPDTALFGEQPRW